MQSTTGVLPAILICLGLLLLYALVMRLRNDRAQITVMPGVFKPLCGVDDGIYAVILAAVNAELARAADKFRIVSVRELNS
jgi:cellobiose-specific phosphotransferase system component IIC